MSNYTNLDRFGSFSKTEQTKDCRSRPKEYLLPFVGQQNTSKLGKVLHVKDV